MPRFMVEYKISDRNDDGVETSHVRRTVDHLWEGLGDVLVDPGLEFLTIRQVREKPPKPVVIRPAVKEAK